MNTNSTDQGSFSVPPVTLSPAQIKQCNDFYIVIGFLIWVFVILGVVGNSLTVYVFRKAASQTSTMYLISNLAIVDAMVALLFIPVSFSPNVASLATFYVAYISNIAYTLNQISIFFITILVWQRYVSVCKPHDTRYWTKISVLRGMAICAVLLAICTYSPGFFKYKVIRVEGGLFQASPTSLGGNTIYYYLHTVVVMNLVSYVVPVIIISYATFRLIQDLRKRNPLASSQTAKRDLTKSVVINVFLFLVLQSLRPTRYILLRLFNPYSKAIRCQGPLMYFAPFPPFATILNSSVNFIIYVLCARRFRKRVTTILLCKKNNVGPVSSSDGAKIDVIKF
ncbi:hypothetical protein CAPTEDRAFT_216213 [Capitella teleta]|uniref:G-protein coupled receptors family 1 profile domain-containing protein n=1 Tax=Capitella teleta TaxID=283909 RepID=R7VCS8_CAPTE|nr:hypothetical protein CAPTEDRAFT_216213 [Capitella teleta]|eukprot:ELU13485.1 hypothetical protein CAPTEDRAFT_216213 [Capitella teleta]